MDGRSGVENKIKKNRLLSLGEILTLTNNI